MALLASSGIKICGPLRVRTLGNILPIVRRALGSLEAMTAAGLEAERCFDKPWDVLISLYEDPLMIYAVSRLSGRIGAKKAAMLLLPPFYGDRERLKNVELSYLLWSRQVHTKIHRKIYPIVRHMIDKISRPALESLLRRFDLLIPVSRSIPQEMGAWWGNMKILEPSLNLDREDLELVERVLKIRSSEKEDLVLFSTRPAAEKGVVDALYAFKMISRRRSLRLAITGWLGEASREGLHRLAMRLGIADRVIFTGHLPREELFRLRARARLLLYPSHVDSFSYTVLEALYLKLPVVAYDIPGLRIEFLERGASGISLVKEFDIAGMAEEGLKMLGDNVEVSPPELPSWDEILEREVELIMSAL